MQSELNDIEGVKSIADDIFIFGKDQASHDKAPEEVLQRLRERGLTLNKDKCAFNKSNLDLFGFVFLKQRMSVDPKKDGSYLLNYPTSEHFRIEKSNGTPELLFQDDS